MHDLDPGWYVEEGIGETRAFRSDGDEIVEARIQREHVTPAGTRLAARLIGHRAGGWGEALALDGQHYGLPQGFAGRRQGDKVTIEVRREPLGLERWKLPLAEVVEAPPQPLPPLAEQYGVAPQPRPDPQRRFALAGWDDLIDEARSGTSHFLGGTLHLSVTPAMTLIDVDGRLPPDNLLESAARGIVAAILRFDISGNIGVDFPTVADKAARLNAARIIDELLPRPFERTAINGFGFLQIVRPRHRPSLLELALDRPAFEARNLLRRAGEQIGAVTLTAHPAVIARIDERPDWRELLARQIGGAVSLQADATLAMAAGYAQQS